MDFLENKPSLEIIEYVSVGWSVGETDEVLILEMRKTRSSKSPGTAMMVGVTP